LKKTNKLYIIGNGFDLHHGINTSYKSFADYLKEKNSDLYSTLESYFMYPAGDNDLWCHFEENLANLDLDGIIEDNRNYLPNIASDEFRDRDLHAFPDIMENYFRQLTSGLINVFTNFIQSVYVPDSATEKMLNLDKNSLFLTFNYTYTLEDMYAIAPDKILHIHNGAESRYVDIILGHGVNPKEFEEPAPNPPENLSVEELQDWYEQANGNWDYSFDTGKENIQNYFASSFKDTESIINENSTFFDKLFEIDEIIVLGHSLSDIDIPYFKYIYNKIGNSAKWKVSYYLGSEKKFHRTQLEDLGIIEDNIEQFELYTIQIDNKQLKFEF